MSFFDEGGEPRTTRSPRPRRTSAAVGGPRLDDQTLLVRRAVAAGVGLVLLILIVIGIKGCLDSRKASALRSYNSDVGQLIGESDQQVSQPLFGELQSAQGKSPLDVEVQVNQYRVNAQAEAQRAANLSVPGDMAAAQQNLLLTLDLRAGAVKKIADNIRSALGGQSAQQAVATIAGEMEAFLASDVIYAQRVAPLIQQALNAQGIHGQTTPASQFLPDLGWLDQTTVANRLVGHGVGGATSGGVRPGTHGHALNSVSVAGQTLTPGTTVNTVKAGPNLAFDLKVANQGSNDEFGVQVKVTVQGAGTPITATKSIDTTKAGSITDTLVPLTQTPPVGTPVRVVVSVEKVPGEVTLSNNKLSYLVVFSH